MAARNAARTLRERLAAHAARKFDCDPETVEFRDGQVLRGTEVARRSPKLARSAYFARVPLSATGFYATPKVHYDRKTLTGRPFFYYAYGAACAEVAIDTLTGEHRLIAVDILHDVGRSLNPAIDRGQIEGGFLQGWGWLAMEELWWNAKGELKTHAPSTYKIPTSRDWPEDARVDFWPGENREATIHRSKAVGEPPFMLALAGFHALRDAVASVAGYRYAPDLDAPATDERILARGRGHEAAREGGGVSRIAADARAQRRGAGPRGARHRRAGPGVRPARAGRVDDRRPRGGARHHRRRPSRVRGLAPRARSARRRHAAVDLDRALPARRAARPVLRRRRDARVRRGRRGRRTGSRPPSPANARDTPCAIVQRIGATAGRMLVTARRHARHARLDGARLARGGARARTTRRGRLDVAGRGRGRDAARAGRRRRPLRRRRLRQRPRRPRARRRPRRGRRRRPLGRRTRERLPGGRARRTSRSSRPTTRSARSRMRRAARTSSS